MSVLIIEDYDTLSEFFRLTLAYDNIQARTVPTAEEALIVLATERPQVIVADLTLPGASGLSLVDRLKADPELAEIPVIALSADDVTWRRAEVLAAGCVEFLIKPVLPDELLTTVRRYLPEPSPT